MGKHEDKGGSVLLGVALSLCAIGGTILLFASIVKVM